MAQGKTQKDLGQKDDQTRERPSLLGDGLVQIDKTLQELTRAAGSLRVLTDYLERHPELREQLPSTR